MNKQLMYYFQEDNSKYQEKAFNSLLVQILSFSGGFWAQFLGQIEGKITEQFDMKFTCCCSLFSAQGTTRNQYAENSESGNNDRSNNNNERGKVGATFYIF